MSVRPSVRTSTIKLNAATNQIVVFVRVDETFTMIWIQGHPRSGSRSRETYTHTHTTHMHNRFTALWILFATTRVSWYKKKHSPTHTHRGHQSPLSASSIYYDPWHPPYSIHVLYNLFPQSLPSFLWSTSWPGTLHFILHTFLQPIIIFFSQHIPILLKPVLL